MEDPFSNFSEGMDKCEFEGNPVLHLRGFSKLKSDFCEMEKLNFDRTDEYADFCVNENRQLYALFLESNYIKLLSKDVFDFHYSPNHLSVSFTTADKICYYRFYSHIDCYRVEFSVKKFIFYEESNYNAVLLWNKTLMVYSGVHMSQIFKNEAKLIQHDVDLFGLIYDNLYFVQNEMLIHLNLKESKRQNRVSDENFSSVIQLNLHIQYSNDIPYKMKNSTFKFICDPKIVSEDFCFYSQTDRYKKQYICHHQDTKCLSNICVGFHCNNNKCLKNNVKCNGIDECGDESDETNCPITCHVSEHLCENECISRKKLCRTFLFEYNTPNNTDELFSVLANAIRKIFFVVIAIGSLILLYAILTKYTIIQNITSSYFHDRFLSVDTDDEYFVERTRLLDDEGLI
ncbi:Low-density lipoprotein receptor-related protein 4 [Thelohanellus kitauei]|uniref:Low-density lipoprotein receptor-related protein 4 n=1 Tax=Thelohanellus kitauei TaxID=669202 RepID=A0A0C2NEV0_THEKT|nr:Low-density lipoprotein receptor-related protein 4 [Thelohanellus kitauei]